MALVFACGETSGVKRLNGGLESTNASTFNSDVARCSLVSTDDGANEEFEATLDAAVSEARIAFEWYTTGVPSGGSHDIWRLEEGDGTGIFKFRRDGLNSVIFAYWDGSAWQDLGSSFSSTDIDDQIIRFEIALVTGASGTVEVWIGDSASPTEKLDETSIGSATGDFQTLWMETTDPGSSFSWNTYYSEIIILDDASQDLDGWTFETEGPDADGTDTDGTGSYADIDEIVNDEATTSLSLAAGGDKHGFTFPARTRSITDPSFKGVGVSAEMSREASGPQSARFYLLIDSTYYYGDTFALTESLEPYNHIWETNPDTGLAWTQSDAESASLEAGIEAVT